MKATGIVRRIDDLGRVVIPKEIRRVFRIKDGDALEIFTSNAGEVIFKKYSPVGELSAFAAQLCETVSRTTGCTVAVTDRDSVIAASGPAKKELLGKRIGRSLEALMETRQSKFDRTGEEGVPITDDSDSRKALAAVPIIVLGDITGCALIIGDENSVCTDVEVKLCQSIAGFLGKQIED
jgi:AbrB family transcriptional regulator (stage V sporulation protein T)